jgi:hypothetical protein
MVLSDIQRLGLLGGVPMPGAGVDFHLAEHRTPEGAFRQHALDGPFERLTRAPLGQFLEAD